MSTQEIILPAKIVVVKFKKLVGRSEFTQKNHPMEGGKLNGSTDSIPLPLDSAGDKIEVLTEAERKFFAEKAGSGRNEYYYSVHNPEGYFRVSGYRDYTVGLTKEDTYLDLSTVHQYIDWKILVNTPRLIAPSFAKVNNYDTVQWYLVEGSEQKPETTTAADRRSAYKIYDRIETKKFALKYILDMLGSNTSTNIPLSKLQQMVLSRIDSDPTRIKSLLDDKYLEFKGLITEAIEKGILNLEGSNIQIGRASCRERV